MRVSYIGNTPAFQAGKVGSIPTTRSKEQFFLELFFFYIQIYYMLIFEFNRKLD